MTLLMSLATLAFDKASAPLAVQISGIAFVLINAYLIMLIAKHIGPSGDQPRRNLFWFLAFLCGLGYYPLANWSLMRMETGLLAVLLSLGVLSALGYAEDRKPAQGVLLSVSLGLAFLTHPDAMIFAPLLFFYAFVAYRGLEHRPG